MNEAYIYDGARTAFGRHSGCLSGVRPDDLLATVIGALFERNQFDSEVLEDVLVGNTNQAGEDCRNVARFASLLAGLPIEAGGQTINRLCGSGLAAARPLRELGLRSTICRFWNLTRHSPHRCWAASKN